MIITYTSPKAEAVVHGNGWEANFWRKNNENLIVQQLKQLIYDCIDANIDELLKVLKEAYRHKQVRSQCYIYTKEDDQDQIVEIEIVQRGVFPSILILKT